MVAPYGLSPLTNDDAWAAFERFIGDDRIVFQAAEPDGLEHRWRDYALRPTASPKLWMDAYLAAFARAGGYTLVTTDTAFRQFPGLDLLLLDESVQP